MNQLVTLQVDSKPISVLCHLEEFGCGDGGWTPVMKIDGNKVCIQFQALILNTRELAEVKYFWADRSLRIN